MRKSVATALLGLPSDSFPSQSELKVAYRKKAWETHPDRFPPSEKSHAESKFKQVSEAYTCLKTGTISWDTTSGGNANVMRRGVSPKSTPFNSTLVKIPFAIIVFGTVFLGGFNAARKEWSLAGCSTTRLRKDLEHQFPV